MAYRWLRLIAAVVLASWWVSGVALAAGNGAALFVFDGSGSMWGQVDGKEKVVLARGVMSDVVKSLPEGIDVGLMAYGHRRKNDCTDIELLEPLGSGRDEIVAAVEGIQPKGSTPLAQALHAAGEALAEHNGSSSVVLVSDGKASCGGDPCAAAKELGAAGVDTRVHVVGFDVSAEEAAQLQCIAEGGGGKYWSAADAEQLASAFEEVEQTVEQEALGAPEERTAEPGRVILDEPFDRNTLGDRWRVLYEAPDAWLLDDGFLVLTKPATKREIGGEQREVVLNTLEYTGELPDDFEVVSEWDVDLQTGEYWGQQVAMDLVSEEGTRLAVGFRYGDYGSAGNRMYLGRFLRKGRPGEEPNEILSKGAEVGRDVGSQKLRLRLVKKEYNVTAYAQRTGEKEWKEIGSQKVLQFPSPKLRLRATNYGDTAPETTAHLRRVTIRRIE